MVKKIHESGADGEVVEYVETPEERAAQLVAWAEQTASGLAITPGQAETLATA